MAIKIKTKGSFNKIEAYLRSAKKADFHDVLDRLANEGVDALAEATPRDTGATAASWTYEIVENGNGVSIFWKNTHAPNGVPVVILIQYGHGTRTGGYVEGIDFINPSLKPVFKKIADEVWATVNKKK